MSHRKHTRFSSAPLYSWGIDRAMGAPERQRVDVSSARPGVENLPRGEGRDESPRRRNRTMKTRGTCPLCLKEKGFVDSHIISEATYRHLFDDKHRLVWVSVSDEREMEKKFLQSGSWEPLLCATCDNETLGRFDTYFAQVWFDHPRLPAQLIGDGMVITSLDYAKFKLSHLASLFRAHHAKRGEWSRVNLGDDAETIRQLPLSGDPGPDDFYALHCVALRNADGSAANRGLIPFFTEPGDGPQRIHAIYGGCHWMIQNGGELTPETHLRPDGSLLVGYVEWTDDEIVRGFAKRLAKERALRDTKRRSRRHEPSAGSKGSRG
jgi:hypothetical protein